jgi:hypothetical protein
MIEVINKILSLPLNLLDWIRQTLIRIKRLPVQRVKRKGP